VSAAGSLPRFPRIGWLGALWLLVYLPTYQSAYGAFNFLFLCNIGVILTAIGLIVRSRLLLSSQAVAAPVIAMVWAIDAAWKVATGDFLYGGTEYLWDSAYPLFARLLSLYHIAWPLLLWWVLRRIGYDPRGWPLQAGIAALAILAGATASADLLGAAVRRRLRHHALGAATDVSGSGRYFRVGDWFRRAASGVTIIALSGWR
jgi:hypothetical protein